MFVNRTKQVVALLCRTHCIDFFPLSVILLKDKTNNH